MLWPDERRLRELRPFVLYQCSRKAPPAKPAVDADTLNLTDEYDLVTNRLLSHAHPNTFGVELQGNF